jgi:hypothetical protein
MSVFSGLDESVWDEELIQALFEVELVIKLGMAKHGKRTYLHEDNASMKNKNNFASISRHLAESYINQTGKDPESGVNPLAHAACRCLMKIARIDSKIID